MQKMQVSLDFTLTLFFCTKVTIKKCFDLTCEGVMLILLDWWFVVDFTFLCVVLTNATRYTAGGARYMFMERGSLQSEPGARGKKIQSSLNP